MASSWSLIALRNRSVLLIIFFLNLRQSVLAHTHSPGSNLLPDCVGKGTIPLWANCTAP
jgi:hypothetical protein